jgi:hypothetical protein
VSDTWFGGGSSASADPGLMQRLMSYINGGSGSTDPAVIAQVNRAMQSGAGNTNQPGILPHLTGDGPNVQGRPILPYLDPNTTALAGAASIPTSGVPPMPQGAPPRPGGIGSDANFPIMGGGTGMPSSYGAPGQVPAPLPPMRPPAAPVRPRVAGGAPPVRKRPASIPPTATALAPAAGSKSPFVPIAAQNQDWSGGALSRYGTNGFGRQGTALDLSKLFSRS